VSVDVNVKIQINVLKYVQNKLNITHGKNKTKSLDEENKKSL